LFFMENNYRSSKNIVSSSNKLIANNKIRYNKKIITDNGFLEPINIIKVKSILDQYKYIIEDLKDKDISKCCILYRNNISSIGLIHTLEKYKIPFYMRDTKIRFFNHWLVEDIINFMLFANDTSNIQLYERFYYKMKGYISKLHLNYAKTLDSSICVFDRIITYPGISQFYKRTLRELKMDFKKIAKSIPRDAIKYIEHNLEYDDYLKEQSMKSANSYESLSSMLFYLKLISNESKDLNHMLGRLKHLQYLYKNSKDNSTGITLSTVHSIKGLEFERVYIVDLVEGDFPSQSSIESLDKGNKDLMEEERRLFYVGMTRAKKHLSLITLKSIGSKLLEPSRFLGELQ
ncbi:MAG: ATP-dependent helicase, partial [Tissierellia bacterium]|nr:ATP-dependent helicase [Tissierellia bacterium]